MRGQVMKKPPIVTMDYQLQSFLHGVFPLCRFAVSSCGYEYGNLVKVIIYYNI